MDYTPTIGLEVHTQLNTRTKLFCANENNPTTDQPNTHVCPICLGHPGTLPVLNNAALKKILQAGLALGCKINQFSKFDRKNYFYPDLPKGYQISQYDIPFCVEGKVTLASGKVIRIRRIHLEEDTGRLVHEGQDSLVDFNRAGVPLIELVTEPDFRSASEVLEFAKELQMLWRSLGISEADMEKGQMRVEANISLNMGTKVEVKNLNSFKSAKDAIEYELSRQEEEIKNGGKIVQETRGWDAPNHQTFSQRIKETEKDYRYFPEPDLPPVVISDAMLQEIRASLPELPWQRRTRFISEYGLSVDTASVMVAQPELGNYLEAVISELAQEQEDASKTDAPEKHQQKLTTLAANYLMTEIPKISSLLEKDVSSVLKEITAHDFAELIIISHNQGISSSATQEVLLAMAKGEGQPRNIIDAKGLWQVSDNSQLEGIAKEVLTENPKAVEDFKKGNAGALQFLVGRAMAKSKGKANPQAIGELLERLLTSQ